MKYATRFLATVFVLIGLTLTAGCNPLFGGLASLGSFGLGYLTATLNPQVTTTTEYYIDGVKVGDPGALGLE
jgi:hypothetical protein